MKKENILKGSNIVLLMLIFTLSLVFASVFCFNDFAQAEKVTLTIWDYSMNERPEAVKAIVKAFEAQNPDIDIKIETSNYDSHLQKIPLAGEANAMPDCVELDAPWMTTIAKRGYLEDLQPFINKESNGFIDDYVVALKDQWTGTYSYLPWRVDLLSLYMVEEYLKEAGFTEAPKTWEEFEEVAKKCTIKGTDGKVERNGFVSSLSDVQLLRQLFCSFGVEFENPDGTSGLGSPKAIAASEYMIRIFKNYAPEGIAMFGAKDSRDIFMSGKAAITAEGSWMNTILAAGMVPGLTWKPFLTPVKDVPTAVVTAGYYGIGKGTKHPEEAWKFVKFITGPEADAILIKLCKGIPGHRVNMSMPEINLDPLLKVFADELANAKRIECYQSYKTNSLFRQYAPDTYQKIFYGKMTVEEAMKELAKKIDEEMAKQ